MSLLKKIFKSKVGKSLIASSVALIMTTVPVLGATGTYETKDGDTLWVIAKMYNLTISDLIEENPQFANPNKIFPGNIVYIPLKYATATTDESKKSMEEQVVILVNKQRQSRGIAPLLLNWELGKVARVKSDDMSSNGYLGHTSPNYGTTYNMMSMYNMPTSKIGENVAAGYEDPNDVVMAWLNSTEHSQNILSPEFTEIGVGYATNGDEVYWTQLFTSTK